MVALVLIAAGFFTWARDKDNVPASRATDAERAYSILRAQEFAPGEVPKGFIFEGVAGTLPPSDAASRDLWIVYASFRGPGDSARIAFQIFPSQARAAAHISQSFATRCTRDEVSWECADSLGSVAVKSQIRCLSGRCSGGRAHAIALLASGLAHVERIGLVDP